MQILTVEELRQIMDAGESFALVNVLAAEKFAETKIPGAENVPLESPDFVERVEKLAGGKSEPVVTYCASERCSASINAAKRLEEAGFANVYDFKGGAEAWQQSQAEAEHETPEPPRPAFRA
jgi:rhodanese-related sulfurtransferase